MGKSATPVVIGHNVGFRHSDGSVAFSGIEFAFSSASRAHALVGPSILANEILLRLIAEEIEPSVGSIRKIASTLFLGPVSRSIADTLKISDALFAKKKIQEGSIEELWFEVLEGNWDIEERAHKALASNNLNVDFSESAELLSDEQKVSLQLATVQLHQPDFVIASNACPELVRNLRSVIFTTDSIVALRYAEEIWELSDLGLRHFEGGLSVYEEHRALEESAANKRLLKAQQELERQIAVADSTKARQTAKIEHGRNFVDSGMPKTHRGNLKRRSQETLGKLNHRSSTRIEEAEEKVRMALEARELANFNLPLK